MTITFEFACPSCAAPGKAQTDWAGRSVRCKHCKAVFVLPEPGESAANAYELAEPPDREAAPVALAPRVERGTSTFTPSFREGSLENVPVDRLRPTLRKPVNPREEFQEWRGDVRVKVLGVILATGLVLTGVSFAIPGFGGWGGLVLVVLGLLLTAIGYFVGAYAAFCEDFLHGMLYLFIPIYTGYYLVTRFDDLWPFFAGSTIGFLMFLLGTRALELHGAF
ncbi:hypothetical protein [Tautonia rosea]|uniref:hypothetical protein n=1 Tax=Tautonia rosea TaxID=2728037 RepID=UPI0014743089|nr:hypothetical protein [Tautonia rosea]